MNDKIIYVILGIIVFVVLCVLLTIFRKKKSKLSVEHSSKIVELLGGRDNIRSFESKISRINIFVRDTSIVDSEAISDISGCGVLVVNDKVQIILKENTDAFASILVDLEKSGQNKKT